MTNTKLIAEAKQRAACIRDSLARNEDAVFNALRKVDGGLATAFLCTWRGLQRNAEGIHSRLEKVQGG